MTRPLLVALLAALTLGASADQDFRGVISDDMCAANHAAMRMGPTDAECTDACVEEHGASYVLVDGTHVYRLSNQTAAKPFAGKKVRVVGTLDAATGTITVSAITGG